MSTETEKPVKAKKSIDALTAGRRMQRFLGIDPNALREDQGGGSYYPHELEEFRRQRKAVENNPEEGLLIASITFKPDEEKITYDFPDGRHIEEGLSGRIKTSSQSK